jgi:hypothetical protein
MEDLNTNIVVYGYKGTGYIWAVTFSDCKNSMKLN